MHRLTEKNQCWCWKINSSSGQLIENDVNQKPLLTLVCIYMCSPFFSASISTAKTTSWQNQHNISYIFTVCTHSQCYECLQTHPAALKHRCGAHPSSDLSNTVVMYKQAQYTLLGGWQTISPWKFQPGDHIYALMYSKRTHITLLIE